MFWAFFHSIASAHKVEDFYFTPFLTTLNLLYLSSSLFWNAICPLLHRMLKNFCLKTLVYNKNQSGWKFKHCKVIKCLNQGCWHMSVFILWGYFLLQILRSQSHNLLLSLTGQLPCLASYCIFPLQSFASFCFGYLWDIYWFAISTEIIYFLKCSWWKKKGKWHTEV